MHRSAHVDTFARDRLPAPADWPELVFDVDALPELRALRDAERLNCAAALLDARVAAGDGERLCVQGDVRGESVRWTYARLQAEAGRIAHVLVDDCGLVPGERVLLRGANAPMLAACWFAVIKAGGIAVATMPLLRAKELKQVVDKAEVRLALCDARLGDELEAARAACPGLARVVHYGSDAADGLEAMAAAKPPTFAAVDTASDDVCLIAFTSGTTGAPKGTMHFHRDVLAACACWPKHVLRPLPSDVFIGSPPLAFTFGLGGLLLFPMAVGASTVLLEKASPEALPAAIARYGATVCVTAPTSYRAMAPLIERHDVSTLRKCVSAGEALPASTRALWKAATGIELIDGIGSTELLHIFISHDEAHVRPGATGTPVPGYRARIVDDDGRALPAGRVGRLAVQGPTGCRYLDDERQRQYVQGGWNLTGDAYVVDADGFFVYQARTDDMIVSGGYNIAGPEVEACLMLHPAVAECAVVGAADGERGQVVKAYVVVRDGTAADATLKEALQDFVKRSIAPYKYPRAVEFLAALPRTETGKLQRFRLRDEARAAIGSTP